MADMGLAKKWRTLWLLALAELLAMAVWFSASAVVPALTEAWQLTAGGRAWLTMSVQIGFVVGALVSAVLNVSDRVAGRTLFTASALVAGGATALIPLLADGVGVAIGLRFVTGVSLAGVYPVGMKIMTTWTKEDRGLGIGLLVGALTVGSAAPHLLTIFGGVGDWQLVLYGAAGLALVGAVVAFLFVEDGPYKTATPPFNWRYVGQIMGEREIVLANVGYLGHMWELYAMWAWVPLFLRASFAAVGVGEGAANVTAFGTIAIGGLGSLVAGKVADRYGRTTVTTVSLLVSGGCSLGIGFLFGGPPAVVVVVCLVWGFAVVADSAQFSACVSELSAPAYVGTALTLQTSLGFLLTLFTIRLVPTLEVVVGWRYAFVVLALGPAVGVVAMQMLRRSPRAGELANGRG